MNPSMGEWRPPVVRTVAATGTGLPELRDAITRHRSFLDTSGEMRSRRDRRLTDELSKVLAFRIEHEVKKLGKGSVWSEVTRQVRERTIDPYEAVESLLAEANLPRR